MAELTREQLIEKLERRLAVTTHYPDVEEAQLDAQIFKIALAALTAEPVAHLVCNGRLYQDRAFLSFSAAQLSVKDRNDRAEIKPLYASPQLPQPAVPDIATVETTYPDVQTNWQDAKMYAEGWNACRAAMLQAGNSPVIQDGWQLVPKEPTEAMNKAGWAAMNEHDAINPTYRAMLAAAPQQDVRLALEIGMSRYAGAMQKLVDSGD